MTHLTNPQPPHHTVVMSGTATLPLPSSTQPESMTGEVKITDELQSKFDDLFGSNTAGDDTSAGDGSNSGPTASQRQREAEEAEELEGLEGASGEDTKGEQFSQDEPEKKEPEAGKEGSDDKGKAADESGKEPGSTLPAYLRHAAKRAGWEDDAIKGLVEHDAGLAIQTFTKLHDSFSEMASRYGQIGQMAALQQNGQPTPTPQAQPQQPPQNGQDPIQSFLQNRYGDNLGRFNDRFGEGFVDDILKPLAEPLSRMEQDYQDQRQQAMGQEITAFFSKIPGDYHELYGDGKQLTEEQSLARQQVYQLADWIRTGAEMSGRVQLSVGDALDMAVANHSAPHLALLERKRLTAQIQKRSSKITSRPTQRRTQPTPDEQPKGEIAAIAAYAERAGELGISVGDTGA